MQKYVEKKPPSHKRILPCHLQSILHVLLNVTMFNTKTGLTINIMYVKYDYNILNSNLNKKTSISVPNTPCNHVIFHINKHKHCFSLAIA